MAARTALPVKLGSSRGGAVTVPVGGRRLRYRLRGPGRRQWCRATTELEGENAAVVLVLGRRHDGRERWIQRAAEARHHGDVLFAINLVAHRRPDDAGSHFDRVQLLPVVRAI